MEPGFRAAMNWVHTWAGVVIGGLLFAIFWMGTLAVFDREIDRWMAPMTRLPAAATPVPLDAYRSSLIAAGQAKAPSWTIQAPTEREPALRIYLAETGGYRTIHHDPATGAVLPDPGTWAGTQFLYPFHYNLHLHVFDLGEWIVGAAGLAMLLLCVTGVIVHRKIFADFFTFRPRKKARRVLLDLHNVAGVLGLPFHIAITLSGVIIFSATYFPTGWLPHYGSVRAFYADADAPFRRPASGTPAAGHASLDALTARAAALWEGDGPEYLMVSHPGDAAAYVTVKRPSARGVTHLADTLWFDGATGALLQRTGAPEPVMHAAQFIAGMHLVEFRHWTLRWLYFVLGLTGCVLIATGFLFWLESRRKRHAQLGLRGVRVVEALTIGSTGGIIVATLAFFVANRLLPLEIVVAGVERAAVEAWVFYLVLLAGFAHAAVRGGRAWLEQCAAIALLAAAAVLLNWVTTGDHLLRSLAARHLWPVAGMDLLLMLGGAAAGFAAWRLAGRRAARPEVRATAAAS